MLGLSFGFWDGALVALVTAQATCIAYLHSPRSKALLFSLPIPFTLSALAVGRPVAAPNALGLILLLAFMHGVRWAHYRLKVPIVAAIAALAVGYCLAGWLLLPLVPPGPGAFWWALGLTTAVAATAWFLTGDKDEPGHRTPLPAAVKLPLIALVILALVTVKMHLQGFMTTFPFVGVVTAYEARHSLWTICKQVPVIMAALALLMIACQWAQEPLGLGPALAIGWAAFLAAMIPFTRYRWSRLDGPQARPPGAEHDAGG